MTTKPFSPTTALLLIDVQQGFDDPRLGSRNNPQAEATIAQLLAAWRSASRPIIHVQHLSLEPNSPLRAEVAGAAFKPEAQPLPDEPIVQKHVNSAFIGTDLRAQLDAAGIDALVVVGLTTNHCVSTTARMAGNFGYQTFVVEDATATFDRVGADGTLYPAELVHGVSLANLHGEFAQVVDSAEVLARLSASEVQP